MASTSKKSGSKLPVILVGIIVIGLGAWAVASFAKSKGNKGAGPSALTTYKVARQDLTISFSESGEIKAKESYDIKSEVEGRNTIISLIPEGTELTQEDVDKGTILFELDSSEIKQDLTQQEITFASADASYTQAKESFAIQEKQNESDINAAKLEVKFAMMDLQKFLGESLANRLIENADNEEEAIALIQEIITDPNNPELGGSALQEKNNLINEIDLANEKLLRAQTQLDGTAKLYEKEYVSRTEFDADKLSLKQSTISLGQVNTDLALFMKYDFPKQVEELFSNYGESKLGLERTLASARSKLAQAKAELSSSEARYNLQKERLEKLQKQFTACICRAPQPGMVVYGSSDDWWERQRNPIEIGAEVRERQKIISIPNLDEMGVNVQVHESWVDKVIPGQTTRIVVDALPDKTFSGLVIRVAPLPDPQRGFMDTGFKVYTTEVVIDANEEKLRPGMNAKVEIIIKELENAICVPVQAVSNRQNSKVCFVVDDKGNLIEREVKVGSFNDSFIEILEGLEEGDEISLIPPRITDNGSDKNGKSKEGGPKPGEAGKQPGMPGGGAPEAGAGGGVNRGPGQGGGGERPAMGGGGQGQRPAGGPGGPGGGERRGPGGPGGGGRPGGGGGN